MDLLPCPFCAERKIIITNQQSGKRGTCYDCGAKGPLARRRKSDLGPELLGRARILWNTRTPAVKPDNPDNSNVADEK